MSAQSWATAHTHTYTHMLSGAPEGPGNTNTEAAHFGTVRWGCAGALGERELARVSGRCWEGGLRGEVGGDEVCVCLYEGKLVVGKNGEGDLAHDNNPRKNFIPLKMHREEGVCVCA